MLNPDRITVDEPLISTDVDNLIKTLAERKKLSLNELRGVCNIDKKNMDKWISVLEEEGYINVEYGLGGTYVHWRGLQDIPEEETPRQEAPVETVSQETIEENSYTPRAVEDGSGDDGPGDEGPGEQIKAEFANTMPLEENDGHDAVEAPVEEPQTTWEEAPVVSEETTEEAPAEESAEEIVPEPDPEDLLDQYVARRLSGEKVDAKDLKSSILTNLGRDTAPEPPSRPEPEMPEEDVEEPIEEHEDETLFVEEAEREPDPEEAIEEVVYSMAKRPTLQKPVSTRPRVMASDIRELMGAYLEQINEEKENIRDLEKQREALYREKFAMIEGKMQADIVALTEAIIEKQNRLAQIRESLLELPDKVDEVERVQEQMEALKQEGRAALERTRRKSEAYIASIEASRGQIRSRIEELNASVEEQSDRMQELESLGESLETRSEKLTGTITEAKAKVEELNIAMSELSRDLQRLDEAKAEIGAAKDEVRESVASHGTELESLATELEEISKVEHWVQEYVRDYSQKIEAIEDYISNSDSELQELKESAESLYMKKYLRELETMAGAYEGQLDEAVAMDSDIAQKIEESRSRISELAKESQEMIRKLRSDVSDVKGYSTLMPSVKSKTARIRKVVEEKQSERAKLAEDVRSARRSRPSGRPKLKAKKTRAKAKAKVKAKPKKRGRPKKKR